MNEVLLVLSELDKSVSKPSIPFLLNLFKQLRKANIRRSDVIVKYAEELVSAISDDIEALNIWEQIIIAALDEGNYILARNYLDKLKKRFKSSNRVLRLEGMAEEFLENYQEALGIYNQILKDNPSNVLVMKRKVAVYRAQNLNMEAVTELNNILRLFPNDMSCWIELGEINLCIGDYESVAHCYEEVVLMDPLNPHAHTRLADCYYTLGGVTNLVIARKHYAMSIEQQSPDLNLRAVYSIITCCKAIQEITKEPSSTSEVTTDKPVSVNEIGLIEARVNEEMLQWSREQLHKVASSAPSESVIKILSKSF